MKKTIFNVLTVACAFLACSCQPTEPQQAAVATMKGEYYADLPGEKQLIELFPGSSKTFDIRACAHNGAVCDIFLNLTFKAAPEMVESFNAANGSNYVMCPVSAYEFVKEEVMMPRYGTSSSTGKVKVVASGLEQGKEYILPIAIACKEGEENYAVADTLAAYVLFSLLDFDPSQGMGTAEYPFLINTVEDLRGLNDKLQGTATTYFLLTGDLDMSQVQSWTALNPGACPMDFDGDGHTITNFTSGCPLFEYAVGNFHDLNVTKAKVSNDVSKPTAILASRGGDIGSSLTATNLYVQGSVANTSTNGTGGMFGIIADATLDRCAASITINSNVYDVGGLFGYDNSKSTVTNCWTSGVVNGDNRYTGGIAGQIYKAETGLYNCFTTCSITGKYYFGGIAGSDNLGQKEKESCGTNDPKNHIEKCIAWNDVVKSSLAGGTDVAEHYSGGAVVGYSALKNYHVDCYRNPGMIFQDCPGNSGNVLCDQMNSSPENPLVVGLSGTYVFPYHGRQAAKGSTISSVAKQLGWSEEIWDLSGDVPFFKGSGGFKEDPNVPADGQLPDFDENIFF